MARLCFMFHFSNSWLRTCGSTLVLYGACGVEKMNCTCTESKYYYFSEDPLQKRISALDINKNSLTYIAGLVLIVVHIPRTGRSPT
jgi:hypothetical protein